MSVDVNLSVVLSPGHGLISHFFRKKYLTTQYIKWYQSSIDFNFDLIVPIATSSLGTLRKLA